jgi:HEAT repeat protein
MKPNEQLASLIKRFPGSSNQAITDQAASEEVQRLVEEMLAAGAEMIGDLADLIVDPAKSTPDDAKARFLLHAAVVQLGAGGKETQRKQLAAALADALAADRPKEVAACLIRELQWIAGSENAAALGKFLNDETLCDDAARALANIGGEAAAAQFRERLSKVAGKQRLAILQHLGTLRDSKSAEALQSAAADADVQVRITAVWALANLGEPSAVDVALKAADAQGHERVQHTKSCLLLAERLAEGGHKTEARRIYRSLRETRSDASEAYVREAAERKLAASEG